MARRNSPFAWFRKHQKVALVSLGVLAMLSFVVVPSLMELIPQTGGRVPTVLASCREFGKVDDELLYTLQQNRQSLADFFKSLYRILEHQHGENNISLFRLGNLCRQLSTLGDSEHLINEWLLVRYAQRKLGITVSDQEISEYIKQLTMGLNSNATNTRAMHDAGMNAAMLKARLREHLIGVKVGVMMFRCSPDPFSPLTRWDWFQRTHRKITAEVAAVPVELFATEIADPSEQELQKFFDDNKTRMSHPSSPESGFMQPDKVAFQLVKIAPSQKMLDSISPEEIEKFYEENKIKLFKKPPAPIPAIQPGALPFPTLFNTTPLGRFDDATKVEQDDATEPENDASETSMPEETPAETPMPAEKEGKAEEMDESSFHRVMPTTRPVSFLDETPMEEAQTEESASSEPTDRPAILEVPTTTPELPILEAPTTIPGVSEHEIDMGILYLPLAEVEEEIRWMLVQQSLNESKEAIKKKMDEYDKERFKSPPPPRPDLKALADRFELEYFETSLGSFTEVQRHDFLREVREYLTDLFKLPIVPFKPHVIDSYNRTQYLFWVTEFQARKEPQNLEEVRAAVLHRWKEVQARPLAVGRAEKLREQARTTGGSLAETFENLGDVRVVETESFTWDDAFIAYISDQRGDSAPPPLGEVREKGVVHGNAEIDNELIVAPGENFMEVAYALSIGEIGVAINQPETVVYIIRVTQSSPSLDELLQKFQATEKDPRYYYGRRMELAYEAHNAWIKRIQDEVGFKWINKPERQ